jgi:hypothetical protein
MTARRNLAGQVFGKLTVIRYAKTVHTKKTAYAMWFCRCECGEEKAVAASALIQGLTTSCGCFFSEQLVKRNTTHGGCGTPEYGIWQTMKNRCHLPTCVRFKDYGARGIKVCDRWLNSFENFLADMGKRPSPKHMIERRDNNGPYCPENCSWELRQVNMRNKRDNHNLTFQGETLCLSAWAERTGIKAPTIRRRLKRGWSIEQALNPVLCINQYS